VIVEQECADAEVWVFVPSQRVAAHNDRAWPELRRLTDGRLVLLAYTSLPELVAACGRNQPWIGVPATWLERMREQCGFAAVALNVPLAKEHQHRPDDWPGKPEEWDE
jgi:hypothetical protein